MPGIAISNSEIRTFQQCPRRWYLSYYRGLTPKKEMQSPIGDAQLGARVHLALELYYGYGYEIETTLPIIYRRVINDYPDDEDVIRKEQDLALSMITGYLEWVAENGTDEGLTLISTEEEIVVPSGIVGVEFRAKLDQRVRRDVDGARLFRDFKTTGSLAHSTTMLHLDAQMRFYAMLDWIDARRQGMNAPRVVGGMWIMLRRSKRTAQAKPPFYGVEEIRFNRDELISTWIKSNALAQRIRDTRHMLDDAVDHRAAAPSNPDKDCTWRCAFVQVCPLMDDGSDSERALRDLYDTHDPYGYYQSGVAAIAAEVEKAHAPFPIV